MVTISEKQVFGPIEVSVSDAMTRADLEIYRIDHFRPSYVVEIFFNDPDVNEENASEDRNSYAGRFAIFGHDRCVGDEGHCEVHEHLRRFDDRPSHPLTRAFKRVIVTEALRSAASEGELTITVIATAVEDDDQEHPSPLLSFDGLQLTTFG